MSLYKIDSKPRIIKLYQSGTQSAPAIGTWETIALGTIFNYGGYTITAPGPNNTQVAVPETGMYHIHGMLATIANFQTFIGSLTYNWTSAGVNHTFPDGTVCEAYTGATDSNGTSYPVLSMIGVFELAAGSKIGMEWYQGTATPQGGVGGRNQLTIERLQNPR